MNGKRHTPEQIIHKLRQAEVELGQGATVPQVQEKIGVTEQTYNRWRSEHGGLRLDQAKRMKVLVERYRKHYNTVRPHSALGYRPPAPEAIQPRARNRESFVTHARD